MKRGGAAQIKFESTEDKARFATYLQRSLDAWRYAQAGRTFPALAQKLDISEDQVSKYLRARAVPSKPVLQRMIDAQVFTGFHDSNTVDTMFGVRPWEAEEPDAGVVERAAANRGKKAKPVKKATAPAAPAVEVQAPEFEVAAPSIYELIAADPDLSALNKTVLSAMYALAASGATLDVNVSVRAR